MAPACAAALERATIGQSTSVPPHSPAQPVQRTVSVLQGIWPLAAPLAGTALALYLGGLALGALAPHLAQLAPAGQAAGQATGQAQTPTLAVASVPIGPPTRPVPLWDASAIEALANGRHALLYNAAGVWPEPGKVGRYRMDQASGTFAPPENGATRAVNLSRSLLDRDYVNVEVLGVRLVTARHLAPEEAGSSVDAGVSAPSETILAERPAWLVLAKAQDRQLPNWPEFANPAPLRTQVELVVIDATSDALLLRPAAALVDDFDAVISRLAYHPARDTTRPLGYFGDAAP